MKIALFIFFHLAGSLRAALPDYLNSLPTTYQELNFAKEKLSELLGPSGYHLTEESLDISEEVSIPGLGRTVKVMTPNYAMRTVMFCSVQLETLNQFCGRIYLVIADKHAESSLNMGTFNSTTVKTKAIGRFLGEGEYFLLLLSKDINPFSFTSDISPLDFLLSQKEKSHQFKEKLILSR